MTRMKKKKKKMMIGLHEKLTDGFGLDDRLDGVGDTHIEQGKTWRDLPALVWGTL